MSAIELVQAGGYRLAARDLAGAITLFEDALALGRRASYASHDEAAFVGMMLGTEIGGHLLASDVPHWEVTHALSRLQDPFS